MKTREQRTANSETKEEEPAGGSGNSYEKGFIRIQFVSKKIIKFNEPQIVIFMMIILFYIVHSAGHLLKCGELKV